MVCLDRRFSRFQSIRTSHPYDTAALAVAKTTKKVKMEPDGFPVTHVISHDIVHARLTNLLTVYAPIVVTKLIDYSQGVLRGIEQVGSETRTLLRGVVHRSLSDELTLCLGRCSIAEQNDRSERMMVEMPRLV